MQYNILIVKETRANECRVSLLPQEIEQLIKLGHKIYVEHNAGVHAGFSDENYQHAGAILRYINNDSIEDYKNLFAGINFIARVKRPTHSREILENNAISKNTIMIGALDPLERNSSHVDEYRKAKIWAYSIDQLSLPPDNPMNILAAMSKIAGRLALFDAIAKAQTSSKKIVIIGFGTVGQAAFTAAVEKKFLPIVILSNSQKIKEIEKQGGNAIWLNKNESLRQQQEKIKNIITDADIVITSARNNDQLAPVLITKDILQSMKRNSVIVDMALSEGGNVEGSQHDATLILGNDVIVTNTSGYPKALPQDASKLWSIASLHVITGLANQDAFLKQCLVSA